jgi:aryl-alcohol dehydrogenase-like predicted oxidoreductase
MLAGSFCHRQYVSLRRDAVQYRRLGKTDLQVSEIGFGGWGIGGWGTRDDEGALRSLRRAFELGINFYDTALGYGDGHSENLIGKAFKRERDKVVIASKIPPKNFRWPVTPGDPIAETFPPDWIISCTERSLLNLGTDYLDVQQLHAWTDAYLEQPDWLETLQWLKRQGKVRAFGVSLNDWEPYDGAQLARAGLVDSIQVIYNLFEQRPAERLFPAALESQTGIIVRVPFEEGLLTGALRPGYRFGQGDWRADWLNDERLQQAAERVDRLKQFLGPGAPTLARLALKFCLSHPAVTTAIPGMRRVVNVEANAAASDGRLLGQETLKRLKAHAFNHGWSYPWSVR